MCNGRTSPLDPAREQEHTGSAMQIPRPVQVTTQNMRPRDGQFRSPRHRLLFASAARLYPAVVRNDLRPSRMSSERDFGCSQAAKCPPLSRLL